MPRYSFAHLSDRSLVEHGKSIVRRRRKDTAELIAVIVDVASRKVHLKASYSSLYRWCVGVLELSPQSAYKHMYAAGAARWFPEIIDMVADGRLHLSAVVTLRSHLRKDNAAELLTAAAGKTRAQIEFMLAQRFPRPDLPTFVQAIPRPAPASLQLSPGKVEHESEVLHSAAAPVLTIPAVAAAPSRIQPLAPQRFALQTTIDQETSDLLREAQELLGHAGSSQVPDVLKAALQLYVEKLRKQKFGATDAPRPGRERNPDSRRVPEEIKRAVWRRDGGQCTFVGDSGHRCEERSGLEFDHVIPYARGGDTSVGNVRVLCQAHNQCEAERTYGPEFMRSKREAKRAASAG